MNFPVIYRVEGDYHLAISTPNNEPITPIAGFVLVQDKRDQKIYRVPDTPDVRRFFHFAADEPSASNMPATGTTASVQTLAHEGSSSRATATEKTSAVSEGSSPHITVGSSSPIEAASDGERDKLEDPVTDGEFRWERPAILLLLSTFKSEEPNMTSGKISMKKFWDRISSHLKDMGHDVTGLQCKSKLNGMKKTYKTVKDHNNKSGNNRRTWPYFQVMDEMFCDRPWVAPVSTLQSSDDISVPKTRSTSPRPTHAVEPDKKRAKTSNVSSPNEDILQALQLNADQRAKLHQEAMSRQDRLLDILSQLIPKQ